jgi:hypothetical protein
MSSIFRQNILNQTGLVENIFIISYIEMATQYSQPARVVWIELNGLQKIENLCGQRSIRQTHIIGLFQYSQ